MSRIIFWTFLSIAAVFSIWLEVHFLNPSCDSDCQFESLQPPVVLTIKGETGVVCIDENNTIWKGEDLGLDGFGKKHCNYAFIILTSNYQQGDTIVPAMSAYQKGEIIEK